MAVAAVGVGLAGAPAPLTTGLMRTRLAAGGGRAGRKPRSAAPVGCYSASRGRGLRDGGQPRRRQRRCAAGGSTRRRPERRRRRLRASRRRPRGDNRVAARHTAIAACQAARVTGPGVGGGRRAKVGQVDFARGGGGARTGGRATGQRGGERPAPGARACRGTPLGSATRCASAWAGCRPGGGDGVRGEAFAPQSALKLERIPVIFSRCQQLGSTTAQILYVDSRGGGSHWAASACNQLSAGLAHGRLLQHSLHRHCCTTAGRDPTDHRQPGRPRACQRAPIHPRNATWDSVGSSSELVSLFFESCLSGHFGDW